MGWEARPEMNTPGRHRAIGQLPNLTDFRDSFLTPLWPLLPLCCSSTMPDMPFTLPGSLLPDIRMTNFLASPSGVSSKFTF